MKKILIATGIFPPDIGGPAQYAKNLLEEFLRRGFKARVLSYKTEKRLPPGLRHLWYFFRLLFVLPDSDLIIALDTFSVGLPAVLAAKIFNKKIIIRTGGDFLWESYVERTGHLIALPRFYEKMPVLSVKEKIVFSLTKFLLKNCSALVFSTSWQKEIFERYYGLKSNKSFIIENFFGEKITSSAPKEKNFIYAGRPLKLKNLEILKGAFGEAAKQDSGLKLEIITGRPYSEVMEKLRRCYAAILVSLSEISPNFILDAISANKPFILTKETGLYEKLKDIGIFINPLDKNDIKEKILSLANDKIYEETKNKIENFNFRHAWEEIASEFLNVFSCLDDKTGADES